MGWSIENVCSAEQYKGIRRIHQTSHYQPESANFITSNCRSKFRGSISSITPPGPVWLAI